MDGRIDIDSRLDGQIKGQRPTHRLLLGLAVWLLALAMSGCALFGAKQPETPAAQPANTQLADRPNNLAKTGSFVRSPRDTNRYRRVHLANGLEVLLISNDFPRAAVALDLHIGSADNPPQFPGLAHFLEHMLFLGTKKYPDPDSYQAFIRSNGGSYNATTGLDHTNYFFTINATRLARGMDRLAQFFIAPLFTRTYVDKELEIIEAEYSRSLDDENRGIYSAGTKLYNQAHPASRFTAGNHASLMEQGKNALYKALLDFYRRYYHPDNMRLVVMGNQSLDKLESYTRASFGRIPAKPSAAKPQRPPLYTKDSLPRLLQIRSRSERYSLEYDFPIPNQGGNRTNKAANYVSHLLGHEARGSLLAWLRKRGWATSLGAGNSGIGQSYAINIRINLTPRGSQHIEQIHNALFAYIQVIQKQLVSQTWRYDELRQMGALNFRWIKPRDPLGQARQSARLMHYVPTHTVNQATYLYSGLNQLEVDKILVSLRPDNVAITQVDPHLTTSELEPFYAVNYKLTDLEPGFTSHRPNSTQALASLYLPGPNPYIPQQLQIDKVTTGQPHQTPDDRINAWLYPDASFALPRGDINISISLNQLVNSPANRLLLEIYREALSQRFAENFYQAQLAGYGYSLYTHSRGISLRVSGYDTKLQLVFNRLLSRLLTWQLQPEDFVRYRDKLVSDTANRIRGPVTGRLFQRLGATRLEHQWSNEQLLSALPELKYNDWQKLRQLLINKPGERALLVHGEFSQQEFDKLVTQTSEHFRTAYLQVDPPGVLGVDGQVLVEEPQQLHQETRVLALAHANLAPNYTNQALVELAGNHLDSSFFQFMRTENTLGYRAHVSTYNLFDYPGLVLLVESNTHEPSQLYYYFLQFFALQLKQLPSEQQFARLRQAFIARLDEPPLTLENETSRIWRELFRRNYAFNTRQRLRQAATQLTVDDLRIFITRLLADSAAPNRLWAYSGMTPQLRILRVLTAEAKPQLPDTEFSAP